MIDSEDAAKEWLRSLPECDEHTFRKLASLCEMLEHENLQQNLVAKPTLSAIWQRHIADSAQLLLHVPRGTTPSWLDLGAGAGFPGLVIAVLRPEIEVVMVESRRRRVEWLAHVIDALELSNAEVLGKRVEQMDDRKFDVISARAFAPLPQLMALSARFSTSSTLWLLPKGRSAAQEVDNLSTWNHMFHVEQSLTDAEAGIVVGTLLDQEGGRT